MSSGVVRVAVIEHIDLTAVFTYRMHDVVRHRACGMWTYDIGRHRPVSLSSLMSYDVVRSVNTALSYLMAHICIYPNIPASPFDGSYHVLFSLLLHSTGYDI